MESSQILREAYAEIKHTLTDKVIPFRAERSHDKEYGGFYWKCNRGGEPIDKSKPVYRQSFSGVC